MHYVSASFTRPADTTAYAAGDIVANSTTASAVNWLDFGHQDGVLERLWIRKSTAGLTGASFRLWLWGVPLLDVPNATNAVRPTINSGDNAAISFSTWKWFIGRMTCAAMETNAGTANEAWGLLLPDDGQRYAFGNVRLIGLLEARGAYTPGSAEQFFIEGAII